MHHIRSRVLYAVGVSQAAHEPSAATYLVGDDAEGRRPMGEMASNAHVMFDLRRRRDGEPSGGDQLSQAKMSLRNTKLK